MLEPAQVRFEVPLSDGLKWSAEPGVIYQEKIDGVRAVLEFGGFHGRTKPLPLPGPVPDSLLATVLDGELKDGTFFVFDVVVNGDEVGNLPLADRIEILNRIASGFPSWMQLLPWHYSNPIQSVLEAGGEGVVRKSLRKSYRNGEWIKCKRVTTYDCEISDLDASTRTAAMRQGSTDCGRIFLGSAFEAAAPGMVVEVAAHSRHQSGKLREARFLRFRADKVCA